MTLVEGDIRDTARVAAALRESRADAVMHFAAWLSVGDSVRDPVGYYDNNVRGALSVLQAMVEVGVTYFIFSSTAATFGNPIHTPITEDHPQAPINAYGDTKLAIERALPHYERAYGLHWTVLRYFNASGADPDGRLGEDHSPEIHVIPRAIDAALGRDSFAIYGTDYDTPDGSCLRDYVHVADLASAHVLSLDALRAGAQSTAYNLGNGRPISVREVVHAVERVTGRTVPAGDRPRRPGDPGVLFTSSDKPIRRALGWAPRFEELDVIIETAWAGGCDTAIRTATQGHGLADADARSQPRLPRLLRLTSLSYRGAVHRGARGDAACSAGASGRRRLPDQTHHQQGPARRGVAAVQVLGGADPGRLLAKGLGSYFSTYLMTDIGQRVVRDLRNQLFGHILNQSAAFFGRRTTGQLMSRITNDVNQVQQAVSETIGDLLREALSVVGYAVMMFYFDWRLALVSVTARRWSSIRSSASVSVSAGRRGGARNSSSICRT